MSWSFRAPTTWDLWRIFFRAAALTAVVSDDLLRGLSAYAILSRYPGDLEDVSEADYEQALDVASRVVDWAALQVRGGRPGP